MYFCLEDTDYFVKQKMVVMILGQQENIYNIYNQINSHGPSYIIILWNNSKDNMSLWYKQRCHFTIEQK
jgi:hypothetical protein